MFLGNIPSAKYYIHHNFKDFECCNLQKNPGISISRKKWNFFLSSLVKLKLSKLSNIPLGATQYCIQNKIFCWVKFKTPKTFALCCHPSSVHPSVFTLFQLFFFFFSCKITPDTKTQKFHKKCKFATKSIKSEFFFKWKRPQEWKKKLKNVDFFYL